MAYSNDNPSYASCALTVLLLIFLASPIFGMNVIDKCWRTNPNWRRNRQQLGRCSVGFAGKMTNNIGRGVTKYRLRGKVWITFQRNMHIKLQKSLLISSFTTTDGRGVDVHIAGGGCFLLQGVINIVHNAIRMVSSWKIWIDHNTVSQCQDGLIDVTRGSTDITISNNWFRDHDKVMLLGHDDGFTRDRNMRVTVIFNHFGPNCNQRMPRVRFGYAHVANNLYNGWGVYAIGGSMNPSKEQDGLGRGQSWNWSSVRDRFINGASFSQTGRRVASP
ncbi:hypothetical protein MKX01_010277 [Papaver californicum]|nr:hypothetical protein MKX01_010277 [Papaver californicum]